MTARAERRLGELRRAFDGAVKSGDGLQVWLRLAELEAAWTSLGFDWRKLTAAPPADQDTLDDLATFAVEQAAYVERLSPAADLNGDELLLLIQMAVGLEHLHASLDRRGMAMAPTTRLDEKSCATALKGVDEAMLAAAQKPVRRNQGIALRSVWLSNP